MTSGARTRTAPTPRHGAPSTAPPHNVFPTRVAQVDRVDVQPPEAPEEVISSKVGTESPQQQPVVVNHSDVRPVAPAATAIGLVGQAASESSDRPFIPVIDFQELANTLLGDPEVVLRDKTLYGEDHTDLSHCLPDKMHHVSKLVVDEAGKF